MKKLLAISLVVILVISLLTACGGNSNTPSGNGVSSTPGNSQGSNNDENAAIEIDNDSVTAFLSSIGLIEDHVKPANAGDGTVMSVTDNAFVFVNYESSDLTSEQKKEWITSVYNATKGISKDNDIYSDISTKEKASLEDILQTSDDYETISKSWNVFYKNGVLIIGISMRDGRYSFRAGEDYSFQVGE